MKKEEKVEIEVEAVGVDETIDKIDALTDAIDNMADSVDAIAPKITFKMRDCNVTVNMYQQPEQQTELRTFVPELSDDIKRRAEEIRRMMEGEKDEV